jgi:PAS domain S-box-containing protein
MDDAGKTKKQLIQELADLRREISRFESSIRKERKQDITIEDFTDHRRLVEELALGARLLDSTSDSIFLRDADGNFIYVNEAAYKTRGYSRDELLKTNIFQVVAPEYHKTVEKKVRELFQRGRIAFEAAHLKKDGSAFPVEVHMSLVEMEGNKFILSVVHDISHRKRVEEDLLRALKMESIARMAGGIAGQFNSLLIRVISNLSVLLAEAEPGSQHYKLLEETELSTAHARDLARQLLAFARSGEPEKRVTSVAPLLKDTANFILGLSNVWCNFHIADNLHTVEIDEGQFNQAASNIIQNAAQSMHSGGVIDISAVNFHLEENEVPNLSEGNYVKITVGDRGHGIAADHLHRVFDPYFTTSKNRAGLGLSIAYSIIKGHGGTITIESEVKHGTAVRIFLPASTSRPEPPAAESKPQVPGERILIIDDDVVVRSVGIRLLHRLGYENIEFALDGSEALDKYRRAMEDGKPFAAVILDLTIPGRMSGKETIRALLKADPAAKIIVSGGYFDDPMLSDFRRYGLKGALSKPYRFEELKLLLEDILDRTAV